MKPECLGWWCSGGYLEGVWGYFGGISGVFWEVFRGKEETIRQTYLNYDDKPVFIFTSLEQPFKTHLNIQKSRKLRINHAAKGHSQNKRLRIKTKYLPSLDHDCQINRLNRTKIMLNGINELSKVKTMK